VKKRAICCRTVAKKRVCQSNVIRCDVRVWSRWNGPPSPTFDVSAALRMATRRPARSSRNLELSRIVNLDLDNRYVAENLKLLILSYSIFSVFGRGVRCEGCVSRSTKQTVQKSDFRIKVGDPLAFADIYRSLTPDLCLISTDQRAIRSAAIIYDLYSRMSRGLKTVVSSRQIFKYHKSIQPGSTTSANASLRL
jgi:hypothetical protein